MGYVVVYNTVSLELGRLHCRPSKLNNLID